MTNITFCTNLGSNLILKVLFLQKQWQGWKFPELKVFPMLKLLPQTSSQPKISAGLNIGEKFLKHFYKWNLCLNCCLSILLWKNNFILILYIWNKEKGLLFKIIYMGQKGLLFHIRWCNERVVLTPRSKLCRNCEQKIGILYY